MCFLTKKSLEKMLRNEDTGCKNCRAFYLKLQELCSKHLQRLLTFDLIS